MWHGTSAALAAGPAVPVLVMNAAAAAAAVAAHQQPCLLADQAACAGNDRPLGGLSRPKSADLEKWLRPCAGGANIPAVNELLAPFGVAFGDAVLEGPLQLLGEKLHYASGTNIVKFPAGGTLHSANLPDKAVAGEPQVLNPKP